MTSGPDPVALHDQQQAMAVQKARVVGAYWRQLKAEGVDDYDVLRLCVDFQRSFVFGATDNDEDDE